ncbi:MULTISPECIES: NAD(P)/FAD-dependent oxidoreductase [unclassified Sphingobium]|uniref:NAD(P)/FAD-dependent oxidoreductase n=1 Tax=unclassified Sphingobium TaxID=2611147 RepID=UPI00222404C1|nr:MULTISPECIES: FAD-binding oxidoreductase [unclassified Sphingobium]MCW2396399.1 D-arginine dehydrogenase [Sphingobium sp. B8D3B]MCW2419915.1 D-arginine dehydrogenase [Sphingobium sp. B8D3C]
MTSVDILIVGGGIAGFSLAAGIAGSARVMLIEQEDQPGYHASGRSVAFWEETYGGPGVQPLTSASGPMLARPEPSFSEHGFLSPRGAIHLGRHDQQGLADRLIADFASSDVQFTRLGREAVAEAVPGIRDEWTIGVAAPSCADIDTGGLLAAYRRAARRGGVAERLTNRLLSARREGAGWAVETSDGPLSCGVIVDAAGAWADDVARRCGVAPLGITPLRRTVVQLRCPTAPAHVPLVIALDGSFYFKSEGQGRLWVTPHDETPDDARDVVPEELDVARAVDRFMQVTDWPVAAVEHKWAGLRSFAPDRLPVYGYDAAVPGFFWFAGQGGFGMQTAPAAAQIGAATLLDEALPTAVRHIDASIYAPDRFGSSR